MNLKKPFVSLPALTILYAISMPSSETYTLTADAGTIIKPWDRFYERSVGSCHPTTVLNSIYGRNLPGALKKGHHDAGFRYVRAHGWLNGDIGIYTEQNGQPVYTWNKFDEIVDTIRSIGMIPLFELSFMPPDLASGTRAIFAYGGRENEPKDHVKWQNLMTELIKHCEQKWGVEEIRNEWFFELWNEPNLGWLVDANNNWSMDVYLKLYDYTWEGFKAADSLVRLGGPSFSGCCADGVEDILRHEEEGTNFATGKKGGGKVDFVTYHRYGTDGDARTFSGLSRPLSLITFHNIVADIVKNHGDNVLMFNTEWAPTAGAVTAHSDDESSGSFVANVISWLNNNGNNRVPDIHSWWVISDIFEEWDDRGKGNAYIGSYGLLIRGDPGIPASHDIEKPSFNAFKLLHKMTDNQIEFTGGKNENGVGGTATIAENSTSIQVLIYNHIDGAGADSRNTDDVTLKIENIPFGKAKVEHFILDRTHSNSFRIWESLGSPQNPNEDQWTRMRDAARLAYLDSVNNIDIAGGSFAKSFKAPIYSVSLIQLTSLDTPKVTPTLAPPARQDIQNQRCHISPAKDGSWRIDITQARGATIDIVGLDGKIVASLHPDGNGTFIVHTKILAVGTYLLKSNTDGVSGAAKRLFF
jgi:xylan 1,4-beta-xylosidase